MRGKLLVLVAAALVLVGCRDNSTAPRDMTPPAAPRGLYSVTGNQQVMLYWLANTESDVRGYRVYMSTCDAGPSCPYNRVGATDSTAFAVTGLLNGQTRYFAVSAVDYAGNESDLSYNTVFDTPRPSGTGATLTADGTDPAHSGWDFSQAFVRASADTATDVYYAVVGGVSEVFVHDSGIQLQDMGYTASMDDITYAPPSGWSPSGRAEVIAGHTYVVHARPDNYAKFRVTSVTSTAMVFDWAYQTAVGNGELRAGRAGGLTALVPVAGHAPKH